jgi:branched-chain amino acid transport system permease protein
MKLNQKIKDLFNKHSTVVILTVPLVVVGLLTEVFGSTLLQRIVITLFINLGLVLGLQIFMGNGGILNFAHIGFMGLGAYASVLFSMSPQTKSLSLPDLYPVIASIQLPFWIALLIGGLIAAIVAALIGFPLMRISEAAAVIITFALLVIIHVVLVHWSEVTNGPQTLFGVDRHTYLWTGAVWGIGFVFLAYWFKESGVGLKLRASRDDRNAAATSGINIVSVRWIAFITSAFVAGISGGLWAHFITSFSPKAFYLTETFVILTMLVVGGPGGVSGAVIGTVIVTTIREVLRAFENWINLNSLTANNLVGFTEVLLAIILIVILISRPSGIMGGREIRWRKSARFVENNQNMTETSQETIQ